MLYSSQSLLNGVSGSQKTFWRTFTNGVSKAFSSSRICNTLNSLCRALRGPGRLSTYLRKLNITIPLPLCIVCYQTMGALDSSVSLHHTTFLALPSILTIRCFVWQCRLFLGSPTDFSMYVFVTKGPFGMLCIWWSDTENSSVLFVSCAWINRHIGFPRGRINGTPLWEARKFDFGIELRICVD